MAHLYLGSDFCSEDPKEMQAVLDVMMKQKECVKSIHLKVSMIGLKAVMW